MTQDIIQIHAEELGARSTQIDYSRINNQSLENLTASTYSNLLAHKLVDIQMLGSVFGEVFYTDPHAYPPTTKSGPVVARPRRLHRDISSYVDYFDDLILKPLFDRIFEHNTPKFVSDWDALMSVIKNYKFSIIPWSDAWLFVGQDLAADIPSDTTLPYNVIFCQNNDLIDKNQWVFGHKTPLVDSGLVYCPYKFLEVNILADNKYEFMTRYATKLFGSKWFLHGTIRKE